MIVKGPTAHFFAFAFVISSWLAGSPARAEVSEVRLAQQFGLNYLPLTVMRTEKLIEKHAAALGLANVKVSWLRFGGSNSINDALLSGQLDFGSGGVPSLLTLWAKTKGIFDVRGVAALGSMPCYLNTSDPNVKTLSDFSDKDKIALPAVEVSIQAVLIQMAAAKAFGMDNYKKLDRLTVGMKHPDAMAALLSGTEITAHFGNPPYQEQELQHSTIHRVLSSYEVVGEPSTLNSVYTTKKFHDGNPKTYRAVLGALQEAMQFINQDKARASMIYIREEKSKLSPEFIQKILEDPNSVVTSEPKGIMRYAEFMHRIAKLKTLPGSARDVYFPELYEK